MDLGAFLLTGGRSSRLGRDKATLPLPDGMTLAERTAALLRLVADPVLELGPGRSGAEHLPDPEGAAGPLVAVAAGVELLAQRGWSGPMLLVATDLPRLAPGLLDWLVAHRAEANVVPVVGGRPQWLCARYSAEAMRGAPALVRGGQRAVAALTEAAPTHFAPPEEWLPFATADVFADVDRPGDLHLLDSPVGAHRPARAGSPAQPEGTPPRRRAVTAVRAVRLRADRTVEVPDVVTTEEPLEIRVAGPGAEAVAVAVTMRTPGADFELAAGFLVTEGLAKPDDVASVGYCNAARPEDRFNTVTVALRSPWVPPAQRRLFAATAACGVCGKAGIDQVQLDCPGLGAQPPVPASLIPLLPDRLRAAQQVFERTGGLHAAGAFDREGGLLCLREDVGRHNAVDKVVGNRVLARAAGSSPPPAAVLMVSGRVSFEIVQKAAMAGIAVLAAISAPSSLAVEAAERLGITLVAFVRDGNSSVYSHLERLDLAR